MICITTVQSGHRCRGRVVVVFTITCEFESHSVVPDTTLCDEVCQWFTICCFLFGFLIQLHVQSVPITVVSSNPTRVYLIQHYVMKFVIDLRYVVFFLGILVYFTNKTNRYVIIQILLKVALNTTNLSLNPNLKGTLHGN